MALGDFTPANAQNAYEAVDEMFKAIPKKKQGEYMGHLNEVCLFISKAKGVAEAQAEGAQKKSPEAQAETPADGVSDRPMIGDRAQCFTND